MPKKEKIYANVNLLIQDAKAICAEEAESGVRDTDWENPVYSPDIRIADIVSKKFLGLDENFIRMEHDINRGYGRLEHMEDSPRREAARLVLEQYQALYENVTELTGMRIIYEQARTMTYKSPYKERITNAITDELDQLERENSQRLQDKTDELTVCQNRFGAFFKSEAIRTRTEEEKLEVRVAEKLKPKSASLIMNPNVLTDVEVSAYPKKIKADPPKRLDLEWGESSFDNMMDTLYNTDELKMLAADGKSFVDTVFLNGKPAREVLESRRDGETEKAYEQRLKCEIVAYALEAKGKIDVARYEKTEDGYEFHDPIPVQTKVNIREELSMWQRLKAFFGIHKTQKQKVEAMNFNQLGEEERHAEIKAYARGIVQRTWERDHMKKAVEDQNTIRTQLNQDFFGFLIEGKTPKDGKTRTDLLYETLMDLPKIQMSEQTAGKLVLLAEYEKEVIEGKETGSGRTTLVNTFDREATRANLMFAYALTKGMTLEEVLSDSAEMKAQKEALGRQFVEMITPLAEEDFYKEKGKDADYAAYFESCRERMKDTFAEMNQKLCEQPFDFFKDPEPKQLIADYRKADFLVTTSQDLIQACPKHVKAVDADKMKALEDVSKGIGGLNSIIQYCETYLTDDMYVQSKACTTKTMQGVSRALIGKTAMEIVKDRCGGFTTLSQLSEVFTVQERERLNLISNEAFNQFFENEELYYPAQEYLQNGKNSVIYLNEKTELYQVAEPETAKQITMNQKLARNAELQGFETIEREDIKTAKIHWKEAVKAEKTRAKELEKEAKTEAKALKKAGKAK